VDDVIWNVLPKYRADEVDVSDTDYDTDIRRTLTAFATDSKGQREKLLGALRETPFVMTVDTGRTNEYVSKPGEVYLATDRLKELFAGVPDVMRVDDRLRACVVRRARTARSLRSVAGTCGRSKTPHSLGKSGRNCVRQAGHAETIRVQKESHLGLVASRTQECAAHAAENSGRGAPHESQAPLGRS